MKPIGRALVLAFTIVAPILGCGADDTGGVLDGASADGPTDGTLPDGAEGAGDVLLVEAAAVEAMPTDSPSDSAAALDASVDVHGGPIDGASDTTVGLLVVTVDSSLQTTGAVGPCAAVSSLVAAPNAVGIGGTIRLFASGIDPANQTLDVVLTWAAVGSAGSLAGSTGTSNTFNCASAGTETVVVTAAIADGGASCPGIGSLKAVVTCGS